MLVPDFRNEFSPADEDEELFTIPWGKETYIKHYPKLNRPSDKWVFKLNIIQHLIHWLLINYRDKVFNRNFLRTTIKSFEVWLYIYVIKYVTDNQLFDFKPTVRLLYSGGYINTYVNVEVEKHVRRLVVHLNMWPIDLQDMVTDV